MLSRLSTQGASRVGFFSSLNVLDFFFFGQCTYARFFSYLYALPGYTVYMYTFFSKSTSPSPHHPLPPPARLKNGPPDKPWNFPRLIFPLSRNVCFTFQSLVIFQVRCMFFAQRNFFTYAGLCKQVSGLY